MAYPPCPLDVTDQILSDWQAGQLPPDRTQQVRAHIPTCAACQQRVADFASAREALANQPIPYLQDRIWRGMQAQASGNRRTAPAMRPARVIGIVGIATATLLVVLFVSLVTLTRHPGISGAPTATVPPTATPDISPLTPAQAWGTTNTHVMTITGQTYIINGLLPNGVGVVGVSYDNRAPRPQPTIVLITYPALTVQKLFTTSTWNSAFVATDGRYVAWAGGFNLTGGPGDTQETVGYRDLQTGQTRTLINGTGDHLDVGNITVTHGELFIPTYTAATHSVLMVDLANGAQQSLLPPHVNVIVSWPYVLTLDNSPGATKNLKALSIAMLYNVPTQQASDVTQLLQQKADSIVTIAMDGATLFMVQTDDAGSVLRYEEIDHADQPDAKANILFTLPASSFQQVNSARFVAADQRLLLLIGPQLPDAIWDRMQQRLIALPTLSDNDNRQHLLDNGVLAYWQSGDAASPLVLRVAANLPVRPGAL